MSCQTIWKCPKTGKKAVLELGGEIHFSEDPRSWGGYLGTIALFSRNYTIGDVDDCKSLREYLTDTLYGLPDSDVVIRYAEQEGWLAKFIDDERGPCFNLYDGCEHIEKDDADCLLDNLLEYATERQLVEYLQASGHYLAESLWLADYGGGNIRIETWCQRDREPEGVHLVERKKIQDHYGCLPLTSYFLAKARRDMDNELESYNAWLQGDVYELSFFDENDDCLESFLFYGYDKYRKWVGEYSGHYRWLLDKLEKEGEEVWAA